MGGGRGGPVSASSASAGGAFIRQGRDPFSELGVPATAIRLAQWAGCAIRTETDKAFVYCYDRCQSPVARPWLVCQKFASK